MRFMRLQPTPARARAHAQAGFTLIELLVVIALLAMLIGLVGPALMKQLDSSKTKIAKLQIEEIAKTLDIYKLDTGRYPTTAEGLAALDKKPGSVSGWNGPYMKDGVPTDPWGNPYRYANPGPSGGLEIASYGADNAPGGEGENADVSNGR
ncbi:type II secretion system major pseudopilin GspG [uncultured Ottowia sp.]|uniref:type II secretion system major pseudopilin GspG n=1 Tax=uncultured Ottowia sp. TaxID=543067 RepID=UPI002596AD14|nr:type II secretion system major pseudopilin GspG [uncultured Ottowia sp.]